METRVNIGDLDTLVTIQLREQTVGSQGQRSWTVTESHEVFASVSRNISESVGSDNLEQVNGVSLTLYKFPGLTTRSLVLIDGKPYEVTAIDPISRASLLCTLTLTAIDG